MLTTALKFYQNFEFGPAIQQADVLLTEIGCTLLSYAAACQVTQHLTERRRTLPHPYRAMPHPTELLRSVKPSLSRLLFNPLNQPNS
jgi:hypothetical protein